MTPGGLPHSGISGSTPACGFPELIAADHALHRLLMPRHPPCALSSLTTLHGVKRVRLQRRLQTDALYIPKTKVRGTQKVPGTWRGNTTKTLRE